MSAYIILVLATFLALIDPPAQAEAQSVIDAKISQAVRPQICTGYLGKSGPESKERWGLLREGNCPAHHALFSVRSPTVSRYTPANQIPLSGYCCPLPAEDILGRKQSIQQVRCPENTIATGIASVDCDKCSNAIICTAIQTERYLLSETQAGVLWSFSSNPWKHGSSIQETDIPPALRLGITRIDRYAKANSGCVTMPAGGILVGKSTKRCDGFSFRHLLFKGRTIDPKNEPVPMFPKCITVLNRHSKSPRCVQ